VQGLCDTDTRISERSKLLGDPYFPRILDPGKDSPAKQEERIKRLQDLYQSYSRLDLTCQHDRPKAIAGLEQRLLRTMSIEGRFGILDDLKTPGLLRRSLLWQRDESIASFEPIAFPQSHQPSGQEMVIPSWSWMAWKGEKQGKECSAQFKYMGIPFGTTKWQGIETPWKDAKLDAENLLVADAREFNVSEAVGRDTFDFIYDSPRNKERASRCVVLGIEMGEVENESKHYVMLVAQKVKTDSTMTQLWERVGAGYLSGVYVKGNPVPIHIQ